MTSESSEKIKWGEGTEKLRSRKPERAGRECHMSRPQGLQVDQGEWEGGERKKRGERGALSTETTRKMTPEIPGEAEATREILQL